MNFEIMANYPYTATGISILSAFILGMIWYHPKCHGNTWMEALDKKKEDMNCGKMPFILTLVLWCITAPLYSFMTLFLDPPNMDAFFCLSAFLWVGFSMPPMAMNAIYTGYNKKALAIDSSYHLAALFLFAVIHSIV